MNYDNEIDDILNLLKERREREKEAESAPQEDDSAPLTFSSLVEKSRIQPLQPSEKKQAVQKEPIFEPLSEPKQKKEITLPQPESKAESKAKASAEVERTAEQKAEIQAEHQMPLEPPKPSNTEQCEEDGEQAKRLVWYSSEKELKSEKKKAKQAQKQLQRQAKKAKKKQKEKSEIKFDFAKITNAFKALFSKKEKNKIKKPAKERFRAFSSTVKLNFKNRILPVLKKIFTKQLLFAVLIIAALTGAVFGGIKLYEYSKVAYLKPYQEKYDVEFPEGILEEFCDVYGKNQHIKGELIIEDTGTRKYVSDQIMEDCAHLKYECDISKAEHFRAIDISKSFADLESVYATPDGFLSSTQKITFNTLFEKADYKVAAAFYTNTSADEDSGYIFPYNAYGNMTEESYRQYKDRIRSRRLYDTGYLPEYEDDVLTISTNSEFMNNFKFVVVCVRIRDKDFTKSDTARANSTVHYPQIWYDVNKQSNPYKYAVHWYPEIYTDDAFTQTKQLTIEDFKQ